ncbi:MAG: ribokinase [Spirochaetes bacterium]|nr:ribokinase [Spirochaetota bacterium]
MRILNFGSLNIDYVYRLDAFVAPGETKAASSLTVNAGGKGLNQSIALAKAGGKVSHAGKIGPEGAFLLETLEKGGVDASLVERSEEATGHAIIQVDDEGRNCIIIHGGANRDIDGAYIGRVLSAFGPGDLILLQNEIASIPLIMKKAHASGIKIAMNPSPLGPEFSSYPLELVDIFIMNEIEAAGLSGEPEPERAAKVLLARRPEARIVITLGSEGAFYADSGTSLRRPAHRVKAVDTTAGKQNVREKDCHRDSNRGNARNYGCAGNHRA